jgi:hypothetical protein
MNDTSELVKQTKDAIRRTAAALRSEYPRESLAGYALLTDDAVETLSYLAISKEALAANPQEDLLFSPTDWPYEPESTAFDVAAQQLRVRSSQTDLRAHVDESFAALVQALAESKKEGVFPEGVFLSVLSTDPSPHLEALEKAAIQLLNDASLADERERFIEKWKR